MLERVNVPDANWSRQNVLNLFDFTASWKLIYDWPSKINQDFGCFCGRLDHTFHHHFGITLQSEDGDWNMFDLSNQSVTRVIDLLH